MHGKNLVETWTDWLLSSRWDHFVTLTFADHVGEEQAERTYARWIARVEQAAGQQTRWARATEYQRRGVLHYHALLWGARSQLRKDLERWWSGGFASVYPFTRARAAYTVKYVTKGGDMMLGGRWQDGALQQATLEGLTYRYRWTQPPPPRQAAATGEGAHGAATPRGVRPITVDGTGRRQERLPWIRMDAQ